LPEAGEQPRAGAWQLGADTVMGELGLEILFREFIPKNYPTNASEYWGGDACQLFENSETHKSFLVWFMVWTWGTHSETFNNAYQKVIQLKYEKPPQIEFPLKADPLPAEKGNVFRWSDGGHCALSSELALPIKSKSAIAYRLTNSADSPQSIIWIEKKGDCSLVIEDIPDTFLEAVRKKVWDSVEKKQIKSIKDYSK
jgi:hypothetical protein